MRIRQNQDPYRTVGPRDRFRGVELEGVEQPRVRPEEVLRGTALGIVILVLGVVLGNFTKNEIIGRGTSYFVLAAALGVALTALAYWKIELVMIAYVAVVWIAIGNSPGIATGVTSGTGKSVGLSQIGMAFLLFIWLLRGMVKQQFSFGRLPINRIFLLYLAFNVLSAFNGYLFWDPAVAHYWTGIGAQNNGRTPIPVIAFEVIIRLLAVVAFWLFANNLREEAWVRRASWLLLLPGAMTFLVAIHVLPHLPLNAYSIMLEVVFACTLFAWLIEPRAPGVPARRGLRFLALIALGGVIFQMFRMNLSWVSGWFSLFVGLYFVAFVRSKRLFLGLAVGGAVLYVLGQTFLQATVIHKINTSGDTYRFSMARAAFQFAMRFPLGIGPGNWRAYNLFYGGNTKPGVTWGTSTFPFSHSFYSQTMAELGFVGLTLTVLFVLTGLYMANRFYRQMPPGAPRTFVLGMAGMWAGICASSGVGDYLIPVYYNSAVNTMSTTIYVWISLGLIVANARLYGLVHDTKPQPVEPKPQADATFYPHRLGRGPAPSLPAHASYYPRRMGRDRDSV